jgi:hypothetical protein
VRVAKLETRADAGDVLEAGRHRPARQQNPRSRVSAGRLQASGTTRSRLPSRRAAGRAQH